MRCVPDIVHERTIVEPLYRRAVPVDFSEPDQRSAVVSAAPSPFGENAAGATVWVIVGAVVSTVMANVRATWLPAASHAAIVAE